MNLDGAFKAYDIRGRVPDELTPELAYDVGRALADFLPGGKPVAVGRDMRPSSATLADNLMRGLMHQGRAVWDIGLVTSDMLYFAVGKFELAGGVMVTASHNPGSDDGIKICGTGATPIALNSGLDQIKQAIQTREFKPTPPQPATLVPKQILADWLAHVFGFVDVTKWQPYKVAFDAGNGMAGTVLPEFTQATSLEPVPLFYELDGKFPNRPSDPTHAENLMALRDAIVDNSLDLGVAFDGDGDRVVFVDESGQALSPNLVAAIITAAVLKIYPGSPIIIDARSSRLVEDVIVEHGGKAIRTRVGNPFVLKAMRENKAPFGAELAAHYYFKDNYFMYSGLIAVAIVIDILSASGQTLSQLAGQYQKYYQSGELNFTVEDKDRVTQKVREKFSDGKQSRLDGLSVNYQDWWFNLRPSNTEPLLRLNVEADSQELLDKKILDLKKFIA